MTPGGSSSPFLMERRVMSAPGLVTPLNFIYPIYEGDSPGARTIEMGLGLYTRMARSAGSYRELAPVDLLMVAPGLHQRRLQRGYLYGDAQTDDARLVLRVIQEFEAVIDLDRRDDGDEHGIVERRS